MKEMKFDPARLAQLPPEIEHTMNGAWSAYRFLTEDWSIDRREDTWFEIVHAVRPDTDQIVFTADDWARVLEAIRGGRGATALPAGAIRGDGRACLPEAAAGKTIRGEGRACLPEAAATETEVAQ